MPRQSTHSPYLFHRGPHALRLRACHSRAQPIGTDAPSCPAPAPPPMPEPRRTCAGKRTARRPLPQFLQTHTPGRQHPKTPTPPDTFHHVSPPPHSRLHVPDHSTSLSTHSLLFHQSLTPPHHSTPSQPQHSPRPATACHDQTPHSLPVTPPATRHGRHHPSPPPSPLGASTTPRPPPQPCPPAPQRQ